MKILIASDSYKFQTSGVANVVVTHADELRRRGYDVRVLALSNDHTSYRDGDDYYISSHHMPVYPDVRLSFVRHHPLLRELKDWHPDIIHIHTEGSVASMARIIAAANHTPFVMTSHTDYAQFAFGRFCRAVPVRLIMSALGAYVYRGARFVIAPSEKALTFPQLKRTLHHAVVVPNGIKLQQYQRPVSPDEKAQLREMYGLNDNGRLLVIISRLSHEKNIREILAYMPMLKQRDSGVRLMIVGDGPDRAHLEEISRQLGLEQCVCFTGRIAPEEVYRYYSLGDVFVSASTFEVHSLTYLEAMARGLPLVCRDDPCLKGVLVDGENGVAYHTQDEFVDGVERILNDDDVRQSMHESALERANEFGDARFVDRTLALYEQVLRAS